MLKRQSEALKTEGLMVYMRKGAERPILLLAQILEL